jgi:hypothetical protein
MAYNRAMTIRTLLLASLFSFTACGGGSKKPDTTTPPATSEAPTPDNTAAAPPPVEEKVAEPPAPPPPPPPKLVLGDAKIVMKAKSKKETMDGEIVLAADGTVTANITQTIGKKKDKKTKVGKLTAMGELSDDAGEVIAKIGDGDSVHARQVREEKQDGKVVKSEATYEDVGTLDNEGAFTNKKDGKKFTIDDKGKLVGFPAEMQFTITATTPEQKKAAMFVVIAMFAASKSSMEMTNAKASSAEAPKPATKK